MPNKNILTKILKTDLFDPAWYINKYGPFNNFFSENPILHFEQIGMYNGFNPSIKFDSEFYLNKYPDVAESKIPPFLHYLLHGIDEQRIPFDPSFDYRLRNLFQHSEIHRTLDLGCGLIPRNPFNSPEVFGVDIRDDLSIKIKKADLAVEKIPFEDNFFDAVTAYDFIEHIPRIIYMPYRRFSFVELMNEIHRVLIPGGFFISHTPAYPSSLAFRDPTHVNIITDETFSLYFDDEYKLAKMYGFNGSFHVEYQSRVNNNDYLNTILRKC